MKKTYDSVTELIGNTPLLSIHNICEKHNVTAEILAKLEYFNPAGSSKDRVGLKMIEDAEKAGKLKPGATIIEETSGNTGIGLAAVACVKGYRLIIVMPDSMSVERQKLMKAYGAEVILTPGILGMQGAADKVDELAKSIPDCFVAGQFVNPSNPEAHYETTGPEIYADTDGKIDTFIATIGTGGTLTGTAKYLKEKIPGIKIVGIEPEASPFLTKGTSGQHKIQGIGAGFIPDVLDMKLVDEVMTVSDSEAYDFARQIAKTDGILVGISSGAAVAAAIRYAKRPENAGKRIVVLLPDGGSRYLSGDLFS